LVADMQNPAIPVLQNEQFFDYLLHWAMSIASLPKDGSGPGAASQCGYCPRAD
jgi:hypothetical protein